MAAIDILIRAKNEAGQKFKQIEREANAMAHNLGRNTAFLRSAFTAIGGVVIAAAAAIAGGVAKTVGAYMQSEVAVSKLREAHRAWGDEVEGNIARETEFASALMKATNVEDESIITSMAQLRMLGMRTEALEDGAKAVIALTRAGAGEEGAARMVAEAYQGNYERLQRYIPALKMASSEAEKAAIVNAFLSKQLAAQQGETGTMAGQWAALKIQIGETFEQIGKAVAETGVVQSGMKNILSSVVAIGDAISGWVSGGGLEEVAGMFRNMGAFLTGGKIETTGQIANRKDAETRQLAKDERAGIKPPPPPPPPPVLAIAGTDPEIKLRAERIAAAKAVAAEQQKQAQAQYEAERDAIESNISREEGAAGEVGKLKAKLELDAAKTAHNERMKAIADEAKAKFDADKKGNEEAIKAAENEIAAAEKAGDIRQKRHEEVKTLEDKLLGDQKRISDEIAKDAEKAAKDQEEKAAAAALKIQEKEAQGKIDKFEGLSEERKNFTEGPRAFKNRMKEELAAQRKERDDQMRFNRLQAAEKKPGLKLSVEDRAFMEDFEAKKAADQARVDLKVFADNQARLQQDATQAAQDLLLEQQKINVALQQLLVMR